METVSGKPRGFLLLSVKPLLLRTWEFAIISDPIHVPDKAGAGNNLALNMLGAARIWLAQANRSLQRVGPINDVVIDDKANMDAILKATFNKGLVKAELFIFGTRDIVYVTSTRPGNSTLGNLRFALAATK